MANRYWIETQELSWPLSLARLMFLIVAAFLIVLIAGCHSAPSVGPDVRVDFEQRITVPGCGQIREPKAETKSEGDAIEKPAAPPATAGANEPREIAQGDPTVPLEWNLDKATESILPPAPSVPEAPPAAAAGDSTFADLPDAPVPPKHAALKRVAIVGALVLLAAAYFFLIHHMKGKASHGPQSGPRSPSPPGNPGAAAAAPAGTGAAPNVNPVAAAG